MRSLISSGYVDNIAVKSMTITRETEAIEVQAANATEPDPKWMAIDAAGHFHARTKKGTYPTLSQLREHRDCNNSCEEGFEECDGWWETVYRCSICLQPIVPGTRSIAGWRHVMPGMTTWSVTVEGVYVPVGKKVSVRLTQGEKVVMFGIAECTQADVAKGGLPSIELTGLGEMGVSVWAANFR